MMLTGPARMAETGQDEFHAPKKALRLPVAVRIRVTFRPVNHIAVRDTEINMPHEHVHRSFADIRLLIKGSGLASEARELAVRVFARLAGTKGEIFADASNGVIWIWGNAR